MEISKQIMKVNFEQFVHHMFTLPEICSIHVKDILITKEQNACEFQQNIERVIEKSYHDICSDVDVEIQIQLSPSDSVTPDIYMKKISRYRFNSDTCLGILSIPENHVYRIIMKNGMRYDLIFSFTENENAPLVDIDMDSEEREPDNADRFWFIQIQALAKLYRGDFLISDHLANMNLNETLVLQMLMRDEKYGTNFHRYGYREDLAYLQYLNSNCIYTGKDAVFNSIANKLYAAALAYDSLAEQYVENYEKRSHLFFDIWDCYAGNMENRDVSVVSQ